MCLGSCVTTQEKGINTEYVSEYAKELVWEGKYDVLENQEHLFAEQAKRLERLRGKVEVIVTDSPILMSHIYGRTTVRILQCVSMMNIKVLITSIFL